MTRSTDAPDSIPLFPDEKTIARLVMGSRAKDWPAKARFLEDTEGLPGVDMLMGGRYWPAVTEFFNARYGIGTRSLTPSVRGGIRTGPLAQDGVERLGTAPDFRRRNGKGGLHK